MKPEVSIIIVTYNGYKRLSKCLGSIFSQTYTSYEVILVDNGSTDETVPFVKKYFPEVTLVISDKNLGFAGGNNLGIAHALGTNLLLLNNDTWMESDFLFRFLDAYISGPYDILGVSEKPYTASPTYKASTTTLSIDWLGHPYIDRTGKLFFYTNGACIMCSKEVYMATGGLDTNFFMYCEEVDRQRRSRLYGYTIGKLKDLYICHAGAGSSSGGRINYQTFLRRNQNTLQMLLKNYKWWNLCRVVPLYLVINSIEISIFFIFGKRNISYSYIQGWIYTLQSLQHHILPQRKIIQSNRVIEDSEILKHMYHGSAKVQHIYSFFTNRKKN